MMVHNSRYWIAVIIGLLCVSDFGLAVQPPPATTRTAVDAQRLDDLVSLIQGPNVPLAARQTGARELLRQSWPSATPRLAAILASDNQPARIAVARALADVPDAQTPEFVEPLMTMLGSSEPEVRAAAAVALATYRDSGVTPRLREIVLDAAEPFSLRLAAVEALALKSQREAVAALVAVLEDPHTPLAEPALAAIEQATAQSFGGDPAAARRWWGRSRELDDAAWQQEQIDRLVRRMRESRFRLEAVESRLVEAFRRDYIRASDAERAELLEAYLRDDLARVRLLGLELAQSRLGDGKQLPADVAALLRASLTDPNAAVRLAAVQTVARLRDPADAAVFGKLLASEQNVGVRRALVNGLGYVGDERVVGPLLTIVGAGDDTALTEAVAALGRLAERDALNDSQHAAVAEALLSVFSRTEPEDVELRERALWAMGLLADPRFAAAFVTALAENEAATVRQTAARGIAALADPQLTDSLMPLASDPELAIRRIAVQALAQTGSSDAHLAVLAERLDPAKEPDEGVRQSAWEGIVRILRARPVAEVESWLERLPASDPRHAERALALLGLIEDALAKLPDQREKLGKTRARKAALLAARSQVEPAVAAYLAALADLHAAGSEEIPGVSAELLRFALVADRYTEAVVDVLANGNPALEGAALWESVREDIVEHITPERVDRAIAMIAALQARPPADFPPEALAEMDDLLARARALRTPTTRPAEATATQPADDPE